MAMEAVEAAQSLMVQEDPLIQVPETSRKKRKEASQVLNSLIKK